MSDSDSFRAGSTAALLKTLARPAVSLLREVPVHADRWRQRGDGPLAVFLPAYGPEGAALLRIYMMAEALRPLGWRTIILQPTLTLAQRRRLIGQLSPDVLIMQGVRHRLNRPEYYPGETIVFDMDDADFHLPHLQGPVSRAMPQVDMVVAGSTYLADWCVGAGAPFAHVVWTGTPPSGRVRPAQAVRPPVIAWAQTRPADYVGEAEWVRQVVARVAKRVPGVTLRLFDFRNGDNPAFSASFDAPGLNVEWHPACSYDEYLAAFDDVAVGLAPLCQDNPFSRGKSFGKVLAYLDARVPVIASDLGEHGAFFTARTGVISNDINVWVDAACRLLVDGEARGRMAETAYAGFCRRLTTQAAATRLDRLLVNLVDCARSAA